MSLAAKSFSNAVVASSRADRSRDPFRIQFGPDWRKNGVMDWHNSFGRRPTKINMFQLRRERSKPLNHQYVVLFLSEDSEDCILRLDRRGDEAKAMDTLTPEGTESIDTIANVKSLSELDKTSDTLAELHCQGSHIHLLNIIKICVGIHRDDEAKNYTLRRFNCYFFAWTMLVATARHVVRWDMLPSDSPWEMVSQNLAGDGDLATVGIVAFFGNFTAQGIAGYSPEAFRARHYRQREAVMNHAANRPDKAWGGTHGTARATAGTH
ncbi:hypothetical protein BS47DRAFT_1426591 [Hydnum rufescens UP504]|uniref:Uncharacterized protein n=1 Tax=Hydnum rufescens UP504 TaxID=1448309 RepID=A0A9P6BAZ8_9AGAM|nr:hypothetical protein BS47DRAFT_1426591 [Hydnum rufescens UP504]